MILSTLLVLASVPVVSSIPADMPEVGVPFACGRIYPVSQGHDTGSHKYNDTYAWDFRMPEGTPVVAAREGVVRMATRPGPTLPVRDGRIVTSPALAKPAG